MILLVAFFVMYNLNYLVNLLILNTKQSYQYLLSLTKL